MAVKLGIVLTGVIVIAGIVVGLWGYFANRGTDIGGLFFWAAIIYGLPVIAVIWLAVLVAVVGKSARTDRT